MPIYGQERYGRAVYGAMHPARPVGCLRLMAVIVLVAVLLRCRMARM